MSFHFPSSVTADFFLPKYLSLGFDSDRSEMGRPIKLYRSENLFRFRIRIIIADTLAGVNNLIAEEFTGRVSRPRVSFGRHDR